MKLRLLLSAAAVICLAWPAAVLADPPADQNPAADQGHQDHQGKGKANGQDQGGRGGQAGRGSATSARAAARDVSASAPNRGIANPEIANPGTANASRDRAFLQQSRPQAGPAPDHAAVYNRTPVAPRTQRDRGFQSGATGSPWQGASSDARARVYQPQAGQPGAGQRQSGAGRAMQPSANRPSANGQARDQAVVQRWREANSGWVNRTPWRANANWWRGNSAFRQFGGARFGFFFIPGLGYVSAPAEYRSRQWRSGEALPSWFWGYAVRDYWNYGLPQPPIGCGWVWVNDDVALIDLSDGYILDIEHDVW